MNNLPPEIYIGAKISGGRLEKYYAIVVEITDEYVGICYNGECRTVKICHENIARLI